MAAADSEMKRKIEEYQAREQVYFAALLGQESGMNQLRRMAADIQGAFGDLSKAKVRGSLVDPVANMEVLLLRQKVKEKDLQIVQLKNELEANRFDQRIPTGQALMRKCKALLTENKELGEEMGEERIQELRAVVLSEQQQNEVLLQKCQEAADFSRELQQENEKFQDTLSQLARGLNKARQEVEDLKKEVQEAKQHRRKEKKEKAAAAARAEALEKAREAENAARLAQEEEVVPAEYVAQAQATVEVPSRADEPLMNIFEMPRRDEDDDDVEVPATDVGLEEQPDGQGDEEDSKVQDKKAKKSKDKKAKKEKKAKELPQVTTGLGYKALAREVEASSPQKTKIVPREQVEARQDAEDDAPTEIEEEVEEQRAERKRRRRKKEASNDEEDGTAKKSKKRDREEKREKSRERDRDRKRRRGEPN